MTARRASSSPTFGSLAFPLLLILFAVAVSQDWLGAPELLRAFVDAWFRMWGWVGEHFAAVVAEAIEPDPAPAG
jgi:ABC-type nitrate/sulfonate/bicarbonate transport system substrate-binding protein